MSKILGLGITIFGGKCVVFLEKNIIVAMQCSKLCLKLQAILPIHVPAFMDFNRHKCKLEFG